MTGSCDTAGIPPLRVIVADDDAAFATALGRVLNGDPMIDLVAVVESVREAAEAIERTSPDVALIGEFPGSDLRELAQRTERIRRLAVVVVIRPEQGERRDPGDIQAVAFLRRESSAEETLEGFLEVAAFAVAAQRSREDSGA